MLERDGFIACRKPTGHVLATSPNLQQALNDGLSKNTPSKRFYSLFFG